VAFSGLHRCCLGQRWRGFFGARHFLADEPVKLLAVEALFLQQFTGDFLELVAMSNPAGKLKGNAERISTFALNTG
jgi:hypothetical protein